jgi:hypothetical protein
VNSLKLELQRIEKAWTEFWFCSVDLRAVSRFRELFALVVLVYYGNRWRYLETFFSDTGFVPLSQVSEIFGGRFVAFYFWFPKTLLGIHGLYALFMLSLFLLMVGIWPRVMAWVCLILHILFLQRDYAVVYGADKIISVWLLYLGICAAKVDRKARDPIWSSDLWAGVGVRLIQVHLCVIYLYSGLEKLRGQSWWSGTALWAILTNRDLVYLDFSFLAYVPLVVVLGSYFAVFFEVYFPFAMAFPRLKKYWLTAGVGFHVIIGVLMNLPIFSLVMILPYLLFRSGVVRSKTTDP